MERRRALEAEPLSLQISALQGFEFYLAGRNDEAIEALRKTIQMNAGLMDAHYYLGLVYEQKGMLPKAIGELRQAVSLSGDAPRYVSALGHAYAISGQMRMAQESLALLQEQAKQRYVSVSYDIAVIYAGLTDEDQTFRYLEMAYQDRSFWMCWLCLSLNTDELLPTINIVGRAGKGCVHHDVYG